MDIPFIELRWVALCLGLVIAAMILLRRLHRYLKAQAADKGHLVHTSRLSTAGLRPQHDASAEAMRSEVQLQERARELFAQLDNKISVLQYLTAVAQRESERLERLLDQTAATSTAGEPQQQASAAGAATDPPGVAAPLADVARPLREEEVWALHHQGFSCATIAHRVGLSVAEVEAALGGGDG